MSDVPAVDRTGDEGDGLHVEDLDPFDDDLLAQWYAAYREAEEFEREHHIAFAFEEIRVRFRSGHTWGRRALFVRVDGVIVGTGQVQWPLLDNLTTAEGEIAVIPAARGRGVGSALLARIETIAREQGRSVLIAMAAYPLAGPVDGAGAPNVEFLRSRGFTFGLGDVQRVLDLPVDDALLDSLVAGAAAAHEGYTFRQFDGAVPQDVVESYGVLVGSLMSEAPMGEIAREAEAYDEKRIRDDEATLVESGRSRYSTIALAPSGEVVGYTDLVVASHDVGKVYQWGTVVRPDHRGHRLGLALKARNVQYLQAKVGGLGVVCTWNADVNEHMIAVNEAIGFRPVERAGEFQKELSTATT